MRIRQRARSDELRAPVGLKVQKPRTSAGIAGESEFVLLAAAGVPHGGAKLGEFCAHRAMEMSRFSERFAIGSAQNSGNLLHFRRWHAAQNDGNRIAGKSLAEIVPRRKIRKQVRARKSQDAVHHGCRDEPGGSPLSKYRIAKERRSAPSTKYGVQSTKPKVDGHRAGGSPALNRANCNRIHSSKRAVLFN